MAYQNVFKPGGFTRLAGLLQPKGPLPISKSTLWQWVKEKRFPPPTRLGPRIVAWRNDDVIAFLKSRETL